MTETLDRDDIQGLVTWGYGHLPHARWHLLAVEDPHRAAGWLARVAGILTRSGESSPRQHAVNVALTAPGLHRLGLPPDAVAQFSAEFTGGMTAEHRQRVLGDEGDSSPDGWAWGGPQTPSIDIALLLYAADEELLGALERELVDHLPDDGLRHVHTLDTSWLGDREHFGFRDGISQPVIAGLREGRPDDTIAAGEVLLGYENAYGLRAARPRLPRSADPDHLLPPDPDDEQRVDFGRNGSYLVVRQLAQDVPGFWRFVDAASRVNGGRGAGGAAAAREALAARIVGRWPDGAPLTLSPDAHDPALADANDFGYHHDDAAGLRCPIGAHVRRTNPRDSLAPRPGTEDSLAVNNRHRLLRRGRAYGPPISVAQALRTSSDQTLRGLHFACLCGNLARQFEFVQHTWVNNPKFHGLYDDPDPLIGPAGGTLTIQARPVRRRVSNLPAFVTTRGGAYFFLPGRQALRYLSSLA